MKWMSESEIMSVGYASPPGPRKPRRCGLIDIKGALSRSAPTGMKKTVPKHLFRGLANDHLAGYGHVIILHAHLGACSRRVVILTGTVEGSTRVLVRPLNQWSRETYLDMDDFVPPCDIPQHEFRNIS